MTFQQKILPFVFFNNSFSFLERDIPFPLMAEPQNGIQLYIYNRRPCIYQETKREQVNHSTDE